MQGLAGMGAVVVVARGNAGGDSELAGVFHVFNGAAECGDPGGVVGEVAGVYGAGVFCAAGAAAVDGERKGGQEGAAVAGGNGIGE